MSNTHPNAAPPRTTPAIVSQEAVRRLPRMVLWLLGIGYVLAGFVGRAPWKEADLASFGVMLELAAGKGAWLDPQIMGQAPDLPGLLPYWLGAWGIQWAACMGGWISADIAARVPFALMLALAMAGTWYGSYQLARMPSAQPVPFAFGGEAQPADYARSLADGALLALIAMFGLAQLSHEVTSTLAQLSFTAVLFYAVAASMIRVWQPAMALPVASIGLALSGAPAFGLALALAGALVRGLQGDALAKRWAAMIALCGIAAALLAAALGQWQAHMGHWPGWGRNWLALAKLWVWFTWPAWPLALLALWRWRHWWRSLHIAWPLAMLVVMVLATIIRPGADRTLLLALPALACLAAMALPTLHRSVSALVDWFTIVFFAGCAFVIWVIYISLQTGWPAQPANNVRRLLPGFEASFSLALLFVALAASGIWIVAIIWRTGRHRAALWKSLAIPAGGAAMCWALLTSLWLPILDYGRSYAPMVERARKHMGAATCVHVRDLSQAQWTALQYHGRYVLKTWAGEAHITCPWLVIDAADYRSLGNPEWQQWRLSNSVRRRQSSESETLLIFESVRQ